MTIAVATVSLLTTGATARMQEVGLPLNPGPDPYGAAVGKTVRSIMDYSRWPGDPQQLTLCLVGGTEHAEHLGFRTLADGRTVRLRSDMEAGPGLAGCDAVYLGRISFAEQRVAASSVRGMAVLTIAENDPACRSQAMVCLLFEADALSFRLNIDAVSRSQVRIDARVLRMGMGGGRT